METQAQNHVQRKPLNNVEPPGLEVHSPPARWSSQYPPRSPVKEDEASPGIPPNGSAQARRNPFGLKPLAFGALVATITALIVGAAVGGGVGGALSKSSTPAATVTATTTVSVTPTSALISSPTNFTVADPSAVTNLDVDCASLAAQPYTYRGAFQVGAFNQTFQFSCGEDLIYRTVGTNGYLIYNVAQTVAYRIEDCIAACVSLNADFVGNLCLAVVFDTALNTTFLESQGNCFLKNSTGAGTISRNSRMIAQLVS